MSESNVQDAMNEVQSVPTHRLRSESPRFALEPAGTKVSGSIISPTFRGMRDSERQRRVWDALNAEYGPQSVHRVGTLLAFTPDEWDLEVDSETE
jgi:acid stress-induced BolA-like protein IbaG/YrbA